MTPDNQVGEGRFSRFTSRQKVITVVTVFILIILIWLIKGIISEGSVTSTPLPAKTTVTHVPGRQQPPPGAPNTPSAAPAVQQETGLPRAQIVNDREFLKLQKATEDRYVGKLSELEELKIQRQISEINQAIATANLATVSAEKDMGDLLTKPKAPVQPANMGEFTNQIVNQGNIPPPPPVEENIVPTVEYTLISVSMQLHSWSAVLSFRGKLFYVKIGDVLPPDGSRVSSINKNNIVLRKDGKPRRINILSPG